MRLYDVIIGGGFWWRLPNPYSPGHDIALPAGTRFKVRIGGTGSQIFVSGHIDAGGWLLDEGLHIGRYSSANAAVRTLHEGTSFNAWLYVVIRHDGAWREAVDVRRLPSTQLDIMQTVRLELCVTELRNLPKAKEASEDRILIAAARLAARMDDEEEAAH